MGHKYLRDDSEANPDKNRVNKRDEEKEENHYWKQVGKLWYRSKWATSEIKKNLKKSEEDCQFLLEKSQKSFIEKMRIFKRI